jgi:hypothetical protein
LKKIILYLILAFGLFSQTDATGAKGKAVANKGQTVKKTTQKKPTSKSSKSKKGSKKKSSKYSKSKKKSSNSKKSVAKVAPVVRTAQWQMIAQGYFASFFSSQKKAATFQTLNGTAAVFKSMSGWQDNKFYILTNELPVGTIVRITTSDLKSICAKVINALPEVGSAIQYRLNDAAAAILGVTNKTFQVSVTY